MDIIKALKLAKEQGKKVRPKGCTSQYIVYEDGVFLVKMSEMSCEYKLEIYSHAIEYLIFEEWEDATTEVDTRIIERKRKAIKMYCHDITIIRDKETGVEYLLLGDDGITPRLKGDKGNE